MSDEYALISKGKLKLKTDGEMKKKKGHKKEKVKIERGEPHSEIVIVSDKTISPKNVILFSNYFSNFKFQAPKKNRNR